MMQSSKAAVSPSASPGPDELTIKVITSMEELAALADEWDGFVEACGGDIYFLTGWLETWWKYYGGKRALRCFLIRSGGQIVAALPFCIQTLRLGPAPVRIARFVGADFAYSIFSPAIEPGRQKDVLEIVFRSLLVEDHCDAVSFSPLAETSPLGAEVRAFCAGKGSCQIIRDDSSGPYTVFSLPDNFDEYLSSLSKQTRRDFRRYNRKICDRYEIEHRVLDGADATARFDNFAKLHQAQWQGSGRLGHFGDWPDSQEFNRALVEKLANRGQVRFHELYADGELVSSQFSFVIAGRCYWRLMARHLDPELEKLGLGRIGFIKMLQALIEEGIRTAEAGPGHYSYKLSHGGIEYALRRLIVTRPEFMARLKTKLILQGSDLIHFLYYRLWFGKLAPRLKMPKRPLWRLWIRTRL